MGFKNNRFFNICKKIYLALLKGMIRSFRIKPPSKLYLERILIFIIFFGIPLLFLPFLLDGEFEFKKDYVERSMNLGPTKSSLRERETGTISINPFVDLNTIQLLSYLTGKQLDLPILNICFFTNDTNKKYASSFKSTIIIDNGQEQEIAINSKFCHPYDPKKNSISYDWKTTYEINPSEFEPNVINLDYSNMAVHFNVRNVLIIFSLLTLSYWAVIILILRVLTYLIKGFEF